MTDFSQVPVRLRPREGASTCWSYNSQYDNLREREALVSVRQIPPNRRSLTGLLPSRKNAKLVPFESALERDLATILEFDKAVLTYEAQPVEVVYDVDGRRRRGVPDFLVKYHPHIGRPPMLCDVKFREELFQKWPAIKPRLRAARRFAIQNDWHYRILTEVEIRTIYLRNARFLLPYGRGAPDPRHTTLLMETLEKLECATAQQLLEACYVDPWNRAQLIPTLWCLLGRGHIGADLDADPLTMSIVLWPTT